MSEDATASALAAAENALASAEDAIAKAKVKASDVPAAAPSQPDYAALVLTWFNAFVENSPVSRNVEAINHLSQVAIPALVAALKKGA